MDGPRLPVSGPQFGARPQSRPVDTPIRSEWKNLQAGPSEQLPMFMGAGEIMRNYQPLDADRQDVYDEREGAVTGRSRNTAGQANAIIRENDRRWLQNRNSPTDMADTGMTHYRQFSPEETDVQLWDRKLNEAQMPFDEYHDVHGGGYSEGEHRTPGYDTLAGRSSAPSQPAWSAGESTWEGHNEAQAEYVERKQDQFRAEKWNAPESLHETMREAMRPGGEGFTGLVNLGSQFGSQGKRQIVGAHHRIASMNEIDPNRLLPVIHNEDIWQARKGYGGHKYT